MSDLISIPDSKFAPDPEPKPAFIKERKNFADNEETCKKVLAWVQQYYQGFKRQASRVKFEEEMDVSDELTRAAITATQLQADTTDQHDKTKTNITSSTFYRYLKSVSAWESAVIIGSEKDIPVKCEPMLGLQDYPEDEARRQADYRNLELSYVFDRAELRPKLSDLIFYGNKYGNLVIEMFWDRRVEKITERVPKKGIGAKMKELFTGHKSMEWKTSEKTIADWPTMKIRDMRNCWFDATIDDAQKQSCMIFRDQYQVAELWGLQRAATFKNIGKLQIKHQYNADTSNLVLSNRKDNADMSGDEYDITKLFDVYSVWIRVPVDEDNGDWNEKEVLPQWYWFAFVGNIEGGEGDILPIALSPNVHNCKEIPVMLYHAKKDDVGAFHMGYTTLSKCHLALDMTFWNEAADNYRQRNRVPLIAERNSLSIRDKTFSEGGNRIWWKKPGSEDPHDLKIQDTTVTMMPMIQENDKRVQDVFGVNKPFLAEALGGRTSASEALFISDQAIKVALEEAKYKAEQLLIFPAKWALRMMDQFSDPETTLIIAGGPQPMEIKPADIYGPINIRITSIKTFQDGILRRREEDDFLSKIYPLMAPVMTPKGNVSLFSQIARNRGFENVDEWFATTGDYDARERARRESHDILWLGMNDLPTDADNHELHLLEHKPIHASYTLLPEEQQNKAAVQHHALHIQMHESMAEKAKATMARAQQQPAQPERTMTPGMEAGGTIAAPMGTMGNTETPQGIV